VISGNLFTRDYLLDGIERTAQWKGLSDKYVQTLRTRLETLAHNFVKIAKPNEAETEKEFIYPVIEALGWSDYQVQQILSQKGRKQVPDALLFADPAAKTLAVGEAQQWKRFQHGLAVLGKRPTAPAGLGLDSQGAAGPKTKRKEVSRRLAVSSCARDRDRMAETANGGSGSAATRRA
jgi:hypothetical protein